MSLNIAKTKKPTAGRIEDGTYGARVVRIIDLGRQVQTDYKSGEVRTYEDGNTIIKPEVWIDFEFPTETITVDGVDKPRWLGKTFTVSSHEKSGLFALMTAAGLAPDGNIADLLGKAVSVTVGTTSGGNPKVAGVSAIMKGMDVAPLDNPTQLFDLDSPDRSIFEALPEFLRTKIGEAEEAVSKGGFMEEVNVPVDDMAFGFDDDPARI